MNVEEIDKAILDVYLTWKTENESDLVTQPPSIDSHQFVQRNHDVSIGQTFERVPIRLLTNRRLLPLQTISNFEKGRSSLFERRTMSPIEVPSYISHQQVENRRPSFSNAPTILPSNPTTVSQKSSTGSHDITTQKLQNTAKYVSQHVISATVETNPKRWTVEEDNVLAMAVESQNGRVSNWNLLASTFFPGSRTGSMCKARWWKKTPIGSKIKGNWMPDEDAKISKLRSEGFTWRAIATQCPGRCYEQVMSRYYDHLDPSVVTAPWTAAEHRILFQEQSRVGNNWKQISQLLPGRSTNQVKNRWYQIQRQFGLRKQTKPSSVKKTRKKVHNGHLVYSVLTNPWTEPEDKILIREHSRLGKKWTQISKLLPGRSPDQLKNRWKQIQRRSGLEKQTEPS